MLTGRTVEKELVLEGKLLPIEDGVEGAAVCD